MYMRNKKYDNYDLNSFPINYSGQYSPGEPPRIPDETDGRAANNTDGGKEQAGVPAHAGSSNAQPPPAGTDNKKSLLGSFLGGQKDGEKKGGILSALFNKDKDVNGGFLSGVELEDLILLAVIFFLLKDGFEDDLIIILALILLSG